MHCADTYPAPTAGTESFHTVCGMWAQMDIGVGSFIVINGISSHHARGTSKPWYAHLLAELIIQYFAVLTVLQGE